MSEPGQSGGVKIDILRSLRIHFFDGIVELEDADGTIHRYQIVRGSAVSIEPSAQQAVPKAMHESVPSPTQETASETTASPPGESVSQKTVRLAGKLKGTPRPGRPDGRGRPTAWCKLAVHQEGHDGAKMFSCTFHGPTTNKALTLEDGSRIVVEGYVRESEDQKRMDSLSVFKIIASSESDD